MNELPIGEGKKALKKLKKVKEPIARVDYIADFEDLVDIVANDSHPRFLLADGELVDEMDINDRTYSPPPSNSFDWLLPRYDGIEPHISKHSDDKDLSDDKRGCGECLRLFNDLVDYHKQFSELPNDSYYDLLALWDFHTYLIEKFDFSPIIYFFAVKERGKSRTSKGMINVARRGIMTETLREANLIRWGRDHRATLYFDIKDFPKKLVRNQTEDLIYGRVERGVTASRVLYPEKGAFKDTVRFEVFGPTIVTSNRMIDDIGESRVFLIEMKPSKQIFKKEPIKELALPLKERLTAMRFNHISTNLIELEKPDTGRVEDLFIGFHRMVKTLIPQIEDKFLKLKEVVKKQKKESAVDTLEAKLVQIIMDLENKVELGTAVLTFKDITDQYNEGRNIRLQLDEKVISSITKAMGFISKRNSHRTLRGIFYDIDLLRQLVVSYGLEWKENNNSLTQTQSDKSELSEDLE